MEIFSNLSNKLKNCLLLLIMKITKKTPSSVLSNVTLALGVLMAAFLLLFGVANLISPDVPDKYLDQNTRVCVMLILTSLIIIFTIFRPYFGGIILCIVALVFFIIIIINPIVVPIVLFGILSIILGRINRRKVLKGDNQAS